MRTFLVAVALIAAPISIACASGVMLPPPGGFKLFSDIHDPGVEVVGILPREISTAPALVGYVSTK